VHFANAVLPIIPGPSIGAEAGMAIRLMASLAFAAALVLAHAGPVATQARVGAKPLPRTALEAAEPCDPESWPMRTNTVLNRVDSLRSGPCRA
jgi:hypothetical protein